MAHKRRMVVDVLLIMSVVVDIVVRKLVIVDVLVAEEKQRLREEK